MNFKIRILIETLGKIFLSWLPKKEVYLHTCIYRSWVLLGDDLILSVLWFLLPLPFGYVYIAQQKLFKEDTNH